MQPEDFQKLFNVSRESFQRLEGYHALLLKWQKAVNLVSPGTIDQAWERHFADSAQLAAHIPGGFKTIADLGSGAGFPGLVLAILRPDLDAHLVESDQKKAEFLKTVSRETQTPVTVHAARIGDAANRIEPDLITARALAPLKELLGYARPWAAVNPGLQMVFPKGKNFAEEIKQAQESYVFEADILPSLTDKEGRVLRISGLRPRT